MGLILERIKHPFFKNIEILVDQHEKGENREPYDIVRLDYPIISPVRTAKELIDIGQWLINEGRRIKKQYNSKGKLR